MRSVLKDVSISELMTMREQGMSNQEIANALGVTYQSILRLIGKQPKEVRRERSFTPEVNSHSSVPRNAEILKPEEEILPASLVMAERSFVLQGEIGRYEIDTYAQAVRISVADQGAFSIPIQDVRVLHSELSAILRNQEKLKFSVEAW